MDFLSVNNQHELQRQWDSLFSACWSRDGRNVLFCFPVKAIERKDRAMKLLVSLTSQLRATPCSLNSSLLPCPWTPLCLYFCSPSLVLRCSATFFHMVLYLRNSQDISLPILPPLLVASPHPLMSLIPSSPSLSLHLCPWPDRHSCLSLLSCGILDSHQEGGVITNNYAKRLTTCHEKIVECQGHKN